MGYSIYYFNKPTVEIKEAIALIKVTANDDDIFYISDDLKYEIINSIENGNLEFKYTNDFVGASRYLLEFSEFDICIDDTKIEIKIPISSETKLNELHEILNIIDYKLIHEFRMSGYDQQTKLIFNETFGLTNTLSPIETEYNLKVKQYTKENKPSLLANILTIGCMTLIFVIIIGILYFLIRLII